MIDHGPYRGSGMGDKKVVLGQFGDGPQREVLLPANPLEVEQAAKVVTQFKEHNHGRRLTERMLAELLGLLFGDPSEQIKYSAWIQELYEATPFKKHAA